MVNRIKLSLVNVIPQTTLLSTAYGHIQVYYILALPLLSSRCTEKSAFGHHFSCGILVMGHSALTEKLSHNRMPGITTGGDGNLSHWSVRNISNTRHSQERERKRYNSHWNSTLKKCYHRQQLNKFQRNVNKNATIFTQENWFEDVSVGWGPFYSRPWCVDVHVHAYRQKTGNLGLPFILKDSFEYVDF